ncbi:MAG: ABC transporter ATP-binding protein [Candidatus Hydrothermia bacterium]
MNSSDDQMNNVNLAETINLFKTKIQWFIVGIFIAFLVPLTQIASSYAFKTLVDGLGGAHCQHQAASLLCIILALYLVRSILNLISGYLLNYWKEWSILHVQSKLFEHVQNLEPEYHVKYPTSFFTSRLLNDPLVFQGHLFSIYVGIFKEAPAAVLLFCGILFLNSKLAILSLIFLPIMFLVNYLLAPKFRPKAYEVQEEVTKIYDHIEETMYGIQTIKTLLGEKKNAEIFNSILKNYLKSSLSFTRLNFSLANLNSFISSSAVVIILLLGINLSGYSGISAGDLFALSMLLSSFIGSISALTDIIPEFKALQAPAQRIFEIMNLPEEKQGTINLSDIPSRIEFRNVYFRFEGDNDEFAIRNLNLCIRAGEKIAIVGPSGAGKTTLMKLLLDFISPERGEVLIDSIPVSKINKADLRRLIAYTPQEGFLFSGTILYNITFPAEKVDMSSVVKATENANIYDKISSLPYKFNTPCGRNGLTFSGGERQRIILSRILLREDFKVLILDEAFREVDPLSEKQILNYLLEAHKGKTIIYITHRLNSVISFDRIIFMRSGEILCAGTHEQLLKSCTEYREMYIKSRGGMEDVLDVAIDSLSNE